MIKTELRGVLIERKNFVRVLLGNGERDRNTRFRKDNDAICFGWLYFSQARISTSNIGMERPKPPENAGQLRK